MCCSIIQILMAFLTSVVAIQSLNLSIIHVNDFHSRFEPTSERDNICRDTSCIGGFSRLYRAISSLRESNNHSILLDAGDRFQGTAWFTLLNAWNVTQYFWNMLNFDAITIGNHEFDKGLANLADFVNLMRAPVLVANINADKEPLLKGLFERSIIVQRHGKKIGIIGVTTSTLDEIAAGLGNLVVSDEIKAVNREARKLRAKGCFTIIVLSHAGYDVDMKIAQHAALGISLVVGGHSHTLLYDGRPPYQSSMGPYPTVVHRRKGRKVLVVQAFCCSYYLGNIIVKYGQRGKVLGWVGKPVFLDQHVETGNVYNFEVKINTKEPNNLQILFNKDIDKKISQWSYEIDEAQQRIVGIVPWDMSHGTCRRRECILGNFLTEAMTEYWHRRDIRSRNIPCKPISLLHAYSIRADLLRGEVRYIDLVNTVPYSNTIDSGRLQGKHIYDALEIGFQTEDSQYGGNILHQTGLRVKVNMSRSTKRVREILTCANYKILNSCVKIDPDVYYVVTMPAFLADGKDKFTMLANIVNRTTGPSQLYVIMRHLFRISLNLQSWNVSYSVLDDRIHMLNDDDIYT